MHVKINHYLLYKCGEGSVNFGHLTPILRETGEKGGGLQNCDPIDYLQISSKVLTAMQPVFFSFNLFRNNSDGCCKFFS